MKVFVLFMVVLACVIDTTFLAIHSALLMLTFAVIHHYASAVPAFGYWTCLFIMAPISIMLILRGSHNGLNDAWSEAWDARVRS